MQHFYFRTKFKISYFSLWVDTPFIAGKAQDTISPALRASCMEWWQLQTQASEGLRPLTCEMQDLHTHPHTCSVCVAKTTSHVSSHTELSMWTLRQSLRPHPFEWVLYRNTLCSLSDKEVKWVLIEVMYFTGIHSNRRQPRWRAVNKGRETLRMEDGKAFLLACPFF